MALLAALLAVAVFTESRAFLLRDEPRSEGEELKEELQEYIRNFTNVVNEKLNLVRRTELGQRIERYFNDDVFQVKRRWDKLQRALPADLAEPYNLAATVPIALAMKAFVTLTELKEELTPAVEEFYDLLYPLWAPHTAPVLKTARAYAKALSSRVQEADAGLNQKLKWNLDQLATWLVPYAQSAQSQWEKSWKSLRPLANQVQEQVRQGVGSTKSTWQPVMAPLREAYRLYAEVFYHLVLKD